MKNISSFFILLLFFITGNAQTTFIYTGNVQTYTVPPCVGTITVDVRGGAGSTQDPAHIPGNGGRVQATLDVIPGEVLTIYVGGAANGATPGWNGGGSTGTGTGGCGGGASDIRRGGTDLANRIIVAAGGGGTGSAYSINNHGGNGGGLTGGNGMNTGAYSSAYCGAGGSQTAGGKGVNSSGDGSPGLGGPGGAHGGGGGAGYYGGGSGAGALVCCTGGGGGGGSSYADEVTATNVTHTSGFQNTNGQVIITATTPGAPRPGLINGPAILCSGSVVSYSVDSLPGMTYNWTVPAGTTIDSGQGTAYIQVTYGNGSGTISVTASNSCGISMPRNMAVKTIDSLFAQAGPDTTICADSSVALFTITESQGLAYTYSWSPAEGLSCTDCPDPIATPSATTTYTVTVSSGTCVSATEMVTVSVTNCGTQVKEQTTPDIYVFPNPAEKILHVRIDEPGLKDVHLELLNIQGQVIFDDTSHPVSGIVQSELDMSLFSKGIYYLRIKEENFTVVKKIVLQ